MKIILIGTPQFGAIILEGLINAGYKPILVITETDKPVGRKQIITPPPVKLLARKHKINLIQPAEIRSTKSEIRNLEPDLIIVAAYGQILPKETLDIPKYGCLNVHPSLLPKYRGPSPIQTTILNGDTETGVTIMKMDEKLDHGEIISNSTFPFKKITYPELHNNLAKLGVKLLIDTIPKWVAGEIKAKSQDESKATYTKLIKKEDGLIDWKNTAEYIERQVLALNPWPGTYTLYKDKNLKILKAEIINDKLIIKEVQLEGKKPMKFEDFLRGHKDYANT
jgi:methionyl-tRNA formyltransferase